MPLLKIGYSSFKNGIEASLQYGYGFMDLIKTNENPYGYHKTTNNSHLLLLTVGYTIPLTKTEMTMKQSTLHLTSILVPLLCAVSITASRAQAQTQAQIQPKPECQAPGGVAGL